MADEEYNMTGSSWENGIIRKAIVELVDPEALRLFDEEQERMEREAQEEIAEMIRQEVYLPEETDE